MPLLIESDWRGALTVFDAIQSYLVEHPEHYYMAPSYQWLCVVTRDLGLVMFERDFRGMSEEDIGEYIFGALDMMR
jgi:hypothetical protein